MLNTFTLASLLAQLFLAALSSEGTCTTGTGAGQCAPDHCNVQIGDSIYCSQCGKQGEGPINGVCTATLESNTCAGGACQSCTAGYFLHKGGCYQFGGAIGKLICTDPSTPGSSLTAGTCTTCALGYFKNPTAAAADKPPCIACNDETGDNTNKGKPGCATCEPPKPSGVAKCTACLDGYYNNGSGSENDITCAQCTGDCQTCKGAARQCTSCKPETNPYWKKDTNLDTGTCVSEENCKVQNTHFPTTDATQKKICALCSDTSNGGIDGCKTCAKTDTTVTCSACTPATKKPNKAGTKCFDCQVAGCSHCSADGVCEACDNTNKVSPGGSSCVPNCPGNSSEQSGACVCNSGFAASGDTCVPTGPNLSTGAIAGISVAAVVVVGGLVGFLCWWFVCRGKA